MEVDDMTATELTAKPGSNIEVNKALGAFVRKVMTDFEGRALRSDIAEVMRLLTVTGNAMLYVTPAGRCRVYRLDRYVVWRSPDGTLLETVIKETIAQAAIPEEVRKALPEEAKEAPIIVDGKQTQSQDKPFDLFTHVLLNPEGQYDVYQEIAGVVVPGSEGSYIREELPFLPLRYIKVDGEDYGRSLVEEHLGDLLALEAFTKAIREFTAAAARITPLINPNSSIDVKDYVTAANGVPIVGMKDDIQFLQIERYNDFKVVADLIKNIEQRLAMAFLMNTAIQRPGERVTAEEIRYMAREVEDILGGTYSILAVELQLPLANLQIKALEKAGLLPELPSDIVSPRVVTGMDALGRGNDMTNLLQFKEVMKDTPAIQDVKWGAFATRVATSLNIELEGLVMTPEEKAAAQQQAMAAEAMKTLGPGAVTQLGQMAQNQQVAGPGPQ